MVTFFLLSAMRMKLWPLLRYFILLSMAVSWVIASVYFVTLRSQIAFNGARPCWKCIFQEGESGIVGFLFSLKLLAMGEGGF
jgi:hypothetical protein